MNENELSKAPAPVLSQDTRAGAYVWVRPTTVKRLSREFPAFNPGHIEAKCAAVWRILRAAVPKGPLNNEVEKIVRAALRRGVSSRELARQFVAVVSSITPLSSDRKEAKAD